VFYVTDQMGKKLDDLGRLEDIRSRIIEEIDRKF